MPFPRQEKDFYQIQNKHPIISIMSPSRLSYPHKLVQNMVDCNPQLTQQPRVTPSESPLGSPVPSWLHTGFLYVSSALCPSQCTLGSNSVDTRRCTPFQA